MCCTFLLNQDSGPNTRRFVIYLFFLSQCIALGGGVATKCSPLPVCFNCHWHAIPEVLDLTVYSIFSKVITTLAAQPDGIYLS